MNCQREEIAFVENATRAWDLVFYSFKFKKGDRIITTRAEYGSNYLAFPHMAKHTGVTIEVVNAAMGKKLVHAGPAGNGQAAKICNDMLLGISMIGVS